MDISTRREQALLSRMIDSEYYEPFSEYSPANQDLINSSRALLPLGWRLSTQGIWCMCLGPVPTLPIQGWKIHLSATVSNATQILAEVIPVCVADGVNFKFTCDERALRMVNAKRWPRSGSGKFMTLYPNSREQFQRLLEELADRLQKFHGPYILSDQRFGDCQVLFFRYGGIRPFSQLLVTGEKQLVLIAPDGSLFPDIRRPYPITPPWVDAMVEDNTDSRGLVLAERFRILQALGFSNTGGVYKALDQKTQRPVIVKEARPHTGIDKTGTDAFMRLENEWRMLNRLSNKGISPEPVALFTEWEHRFLVESFLEGKSLSDIPTTRNPVVGHPRGKTDFVAYYEWLKTVADRLANKLKVLHERGILMGDLSSSNIIVSPDGDVYLVDFEGSALMEAPGGVVYTHGYASPGRRRRDWIHPADDAYALGCIMLWCLGLPPHSSELRPEAPVHFLDMLVKDFYLPATLRQVILDLLNSTPSTWEGWSVYSEVSLTPAAPFKAEPEPDEPYDAFIEGARRACDFIHSTATLERSDRLFPCDVGLVNPLEVTAGALGIMRALNEIEGRVPGEYVDWVLRHPISKQDYPPGLYKGLAGIAWALFDLGIEELAFRSLEMSRNHPLLFEACNVFEGVAGTGLAHLYVWRRTGKQEYLDFAVDLGHWLATEALRQGDLVYWRQDGGRLGFAQGPSGTSCFLLYLFKATGFERFLHVARQGLDFDLSHAVIMPNGARSFAAVIKDSGKRIVYPYWMAGTAGIISALIRFYHVQRDTQLIEQLDMMLPDIQRQFSAFPGLFWGLSGLGNALLDCRQFLPATVAQEDVTKLANALRLFEIRRDSGTAYPGDFLHRVSNDFGTGAAGIAQFLTRLARNGPNFNFLIDELII